jgi:putative membrane protein
MADPAPPAGPAGDPGAASRTGMAAERTWLAWWRTAMVATAGGLGVGRLAPEVLHVAPWPYVILGCGYAALAVGALAIGASRQRALQHAVDREGQAPLSFRLVLGFTIATTMLSVLTAVLVIAQT